MRGYVKWVVEREEDLRKVDALARSLEEQEKGLEAGVRIFNKEYMLQVIGYDIRTQGRLGQMKDVEDMLRQRQDLDDSEKRRVAEYLNG